MNVAPVSSLDGIVNDEPKEIKTNPRNKIAKLQERSKSGEMTIPAQESPSNLRSQALRGSI